MGMDPAAGVLRQRPVSQRAFRIWLLLSLRVSFSESPCLALSAKPGSVRSLLPAEKRRVQQIEKAMSAGFAFGLDVW